MRKILSCYSTVFREQYDFGKNDFSDLNTILESNFFINQMLGKPVSAPKEITELMEYTDEMCIKFSTNLDGMLTYEEMENLLNSTQGKKMRVSQQ